MSASLQSISCLRVSWIWSKLHCSWRSSLCSRSLCCVWADWACGFWGEDFQQYSKRSILKKWKDRKNNSTMLLIIINMFQFSLSNSEQNQVLSRPCWTAFLHQPLCLQIQLRSLHGKENGQNASPLLISRLKSKHCYFCPLYKLCGTNYLSSFKCSVSYKLLLVLCLLDEKHPQFLIFLNPQIGSCF